MTDERIKLLEGIGFKWALTKWDDKFNELKEYKSKHQHFNVPQKSGPLGGWVSTQRKEYKKKQKKEPSQMTDDRIKLLEGIGFEW